MSQQIQQQLGRRGFLRRGLFVAAGFSALHGLAACVRGRSPVASLTPPASDEEPKRITPAAVLSEWGEAGAPLVVTGRVFAPDRKTPVEGLTLYVYHTDARGLYSEGDGRGTQQEPRIKGWVRTDREGRYEFRTTKPGPYPNARIPSHIHVKAYGAGYAERWIDDFWFDGDPFVTADMRARHEGSGAFSPIMALDRDGDGRIRCVRDIRLERA